jgi:hypothetical protein
LWTRLKEPTFGTYLRHHVTSTVACRGSYRSVALSETNRSRFVSNSINFTRLIFPFIVRGSVETKRITRGRLNTGSFPDTNSNTATSDKGGKVFSCGTTNATGT